MGAITHLDKHLLSTLCLSLLLIVMASTQPASDVNDVGFANFVRNVDDIESKIEQSLAKKDENSVVCVPSVQILLGLVYAGAAGKTATELESLFGVESKQLETLANFKKFVSYLEVPEIKLANTAYVAKDLTLKEEFLNYGLKYFNITVNHADFSKKEETAKTINAWVESKTEKLIKDLIKSDDIDNDTKLILLNAIYFKGKWQQPFEKHNTQDGQFAVSKTKNITVKHMAQTKQFQYAEDADYKYLVMPYKGSKLSMLVILPKDHETFEKKEISKSYLSTLKFESHRVQVIMPKFKVESTIDWGSILKTKIPSAFDTTANFKGISDTPLMISKVIQKAFIKVDEEGTEAAAATAAESVAVSGIFYPNKPKEFFVEQPFYYSVQVQVGSQKTFLFQGAVNKPTL